MIILDTLKIMGNSKIKIKGSSVTLSEVEASIRKEQFIKLGDKITVCHLTLVDGHEVIGYTGVVDPTKFDLNIGKTLAKARALDQVWGHMGSILQDRLTK